jgi:two-component system response regulator FlrC
MQLLIIGTLSGQIGAASKIALARGAKVNHADTVEAGLQALRAGGGADLVMADVALDLDTLIRAMKAERMATPVVACGIGADTQSAVRAIKAGAKEYVPLPPDAELIGAVLAAVAEESHAIVSTDPAMGQVLQMAEQVAPSDASILITGPSGTGKELMARFIHNKSRRRDARFVAVNCAAIPENLLESELFGHEKGAFTGAVARRAGKFEEADGGTLLLDEISEMDPRLQAKLLRALQEKEIDRLGGSKPVKVDVRIVATSNRNMEESVAKGDFREDLYFRLNVMNLRLPALAERPADIPALAEHFAKKYADANEMPVPAIGDAAMQKLKSHPWPGNVRELENTLHRGVLLCGGGIIGPDHILLTPVAGQGGQSGTAAAPASSDAAATATATDPGGDGAAALVGRTVADVERDLIIDTLQHCLGNRTQAATILGISIRTLRNKLKLYTEQGRSVPAPGGDDRRPAT